MSSDVGTSIFSPDSAAAIQHEDHAHHTKLTEQLNLEANLREGIDERSRFLRRNMSTITTEHVEAVGPVCPHWRFRGNLVGQRCLSSAD